MEIAKSRLSHLQKVIDEEVCPDLDEWWILAWSLNDLRGVGVPTCHVFALKKYNQIYHCPATLYRTGTHELVREFL